MRGTMVANLQEAINFLLDRGVILRDDEGARRELSVALEREHSTQTYGGATLKLVGIFQEANHLDVRIGEVEERTAAALNDVLAQLGAFDAPREVQRCVVVGRVTQEDRSSFKGAVVLFHESREGSIRLGQDATDADGRYTIPYETPPGIDSIDARVVALDDTSRSVKSSDIVRGAGRLQVIDLVVPMAQPVANARRVEGRIAFDHGAPAEELTLRLYRLGFGGANAAVRLAETQTLEHGVYSLPYAADGNAANLEIRAVDQTGSEVALSKIIRNAGERVAMNLVAPAATKPLAPEFTRLADDLQAQIGDLSQLRGARETVEQPDLTLLHEATGWDARLIATAALATRLSAQDETGLPQDALYGVLRAGLPSDKLRLAQVSMDAFDQALAKARAAGIVQIDEASVPQIKKTFETFSVNTRLTVQAPGSQATYGQMLDKLELGAGQQQTFAKLYLNHRGDARSLWDAAGNAGLGAIVPKLQLQGKLAFLTTNNPDLTHKLQTELGGAGPQQLVNLGLHKKQAWLDRITAVPPAYADAPSPKDAYAEDMARKVRISYSTEVAWNMIDSGEWEIEGGNEKLSAVLRKAIDKGFKLGQTSIDAFLAANQDVFGDLGDFDKRTTTEMIKTLQRVYQITPGNGAMKALLTAGLLSAQDVLAYPLDVFLERFGALFPSMEQAQLVYRKAEQVSNITYSLFSLAKELDTSPAVFAMTGTPAAREAAKDELVKHFPTMESLFGSLDYCECDECQSVLSPAAYLVDLLQFLDRDPKVWQSTLTDWKAKHRDANGQALPYPFKNSAERDAFLSHWHAAHPGEPDPDTQRTPYDVLIERRPDLPHIALTCENTNTALPQIDLTNEIFEYYVANNRLGGDAARNTSGVTTAELLAEPQYAITEAYAALQAARYPLALPFDLWIETARAFCGYFDAPLWQLLETFRRRDDLFAATETYDRAAIFCESLGLSPSELAIFTNHDPLSEWFKLYGFDAAAKALNEAVDDETKQHIDLNSAKALARRLGVSYQEITAIVQTAFVNPGLSALTLLYKLDVTIAGARTYIDKKALYDQNRDLVGKRRADLAAADQQRFDELTKSLGNDSALTGWDIVNEVDSFERRLSDLATSFNTPLNELRTAIRAIPFGKVLVLAAPDAGCNFDQTRLQYADGKKVDGIALLRINLFVRLWRKLGWSIAETDRALTTFVPRSCPFDDDPAHLVRRPLQTALIYVAHLQALDRTLKVDKQSRLKLLTLWSELPTTGEHSLYAQLFLTRSARKSAEVEVVVAGSPRRISAFDDALGRYLDPAQLARLADQVRYEVRLQGVKAADQINAAPFAGEARISLAYDALDEVQILGYVGILTDAEKNRLAALAPGNTLSTLLGAVQARAVAFQRIKGHLLTLQGAMGLTAAEIGAILIDAGTPLDSAMLSLPNVSTLYRYGLFAKALQLSITELIALKQLSGLDPFKPLHTDPESLQTDPLVGIDDDHPFSQTLRFIEVTEAVRGSGLKVEDLNYLLRHRFDETGKYRPNRDATLAWLRTLADGARAIGIEQAVPDDVGSLSDETLRQKLGLALPADVVDRFVALMNGTAEIAVTLAVAAADQLQPADFDRPAPLIRVSPFNMAKQQQSLVLKGVLSDDQKSALKDQFSAKLNTSQQGVLSSLLEAAQKEARRQAGDFFTRNLQKQAPGDSVERGFLEQPDFDPLLKPPSPISDDLTEEKKTAARNANEIERTNKLRVLANAFFPFLQRRLIRQFVVQQIAAYTTADPVLLERMLTDARLLKTRDAQPLLVAFEGLQVRGVSAAFHDSVDLEGVAQQAAPIVASADTALKDKKDKNGNPLNAANSARFEGALAVPTPGAYRFIVELDAAAANVELRFDHLPAPVVLNAVAGGGRSSDALELKPEFLYGYTLTVKNLAGGRARMLAVGETLAKGDLSQLSLYPAGVLKCGEGAVLLSSKAIQLIGQLGLSEREIRYLLTHAGDFGQLNLSDLPVEPVGDADDEKKNTTVRFGWFLRLASYVRMKRDLAGGTDDLIGLFEANGTADPDRMDKTVYPWLARLTRRDDETVKATARALAQVPAFASEQPLEQLWKALQMIERFGVPVASLLEWTQIVTPKVSPEQRTRIASDLKEAIKARFEPEAWLRVAQPIFDKLRRRQRDALVAHVMHQHGFDRTEQLFEFFLIDPGVEPVVQTSRIRSAIGAVQIFIHRCLLNLETGVAAAAINSKQWQWMKRYPVWAGNRKLWLFPENVLEPEFRDDKTHLFAELEGKLLQSDVNNDVAEDAFFTYLKKLDELARLDIVAMYCEEQPLDPASNQLHVIGRTYLEPFRYFYRRYAHEMWTPWEPMPVEIEGNHIVPVVWRARLNVFWVTFIDNPDPDSGLTDDIDFSDLKVSMVTTGGLKKSLSVGSSSNNPSGMKLTELSLGQLAGGVRSAMTRKLVKVQLHWSECFQGEWSVRESGGYSASLVRSVPLDFDSATVFVHATKEFDEGEERAVNIHLGGEIKQAFRVVSRNSRPARIFGAATPPPMPYIAPQVQANRYRGSGAFRVTFTQRIETEVGKDTHSTVATPGILQEGEGFTVLPCANVTSIGTPEIASLVSPLFYQDDRSNTFFVEPTLKEKTIEEWQEWVTRTPQPESEWDHPGWWDNLEIEPLVPKPKIPFPVRPEDPIWKTEIDPRAHFEIAPRQDWLANSQTLVQFDGELVGPAGRAGLSVQPVGAVNAGEGPAPAITVNSGSAIVPGKSVVAIDTAALAAAGLSLRGAGLNIIGGAGLNSALLQNVNKSRGS
jgi:hypothetical protein